MTGSRFFLDSDIWLEYLFSRSDAAGDLIDSGQNELFTSVLSIFEVAKKFKKLGRTQIDIQKAIRVVEQKSVVVPLTKAAALLAAENSEKHGLHAMDSLIYASSQETNSTLVTSDHDFTKLPDIRFVKPSQ